jgi:hypothetical protein
MITVPQFLLRISRYLPARQMPYPRSATSLKESPANSPGQANARSTARNFPESPFYSWLIDAKKPFNSPQQNFVKK